MPRQVLRGVMEINASCASPVFTEHSLGSLVQTFSKCTRLFSTLKRSVWALASKRTEKLVNGSRVIVKQFSFSEALSIAMLSIYECMCI